MNLRPKTKRRLTVLTTVGTALLVGGAILINVRLNKYAQRQQEYRAAAMDAFGRQNYPAALELFRRYLNNTSEDADAVFAYGICRIHVPRPDFSYLVEAKSIFSRYLELRPGDINGEHQLLHVYHQLGYDSEAVALADNILAQQPDDLPALQSKTTALAAQADYPLALIFCQKINAQAPLDLPDQILTLRLMQLSGHPAADAVEHTEALLKQHPQDPRFQLLRAMAANSANDTSGAQHWLHLAAGQPAPDAEFTVTLSDAFDRIGLIKDAQQVLETAAPSRDNHVLFMLATRDWEQDNYDAVLNLIPLDSPASTKTPSPLLALQALSLYYRNLSGDRIKADALAQILSRRSADADASAWTALLQAQFATSRPPPREQVRLCRSALALNPTNAIGRFFLGSALHTLGESELAIQSWRDAANLAPAWAQPHQRTAEELLQQQRLDDAATEAHAALNLAPQSMPTRITNAAAQYALLPAIPSSDALANTLSLLEDIQLAQPVEPNTFPPYLSLLARTGQTQKAAAALNDALAKKPPIPSTLLPQLVEANFALQLNDEQQLNTYLAAFRPSSADDAYNQALALFKLGHPADALACLLQTPRNWPGRQLKIVLLREAMGDPETPALWTALDDEFPTNLEVQRAILATTSAWQNPRLIEKAIDRLRSLTGDTGLQWRVAQARWQLAEPDDTVNNANAAAASMAEVVRLAPQWADPLILWSHALQKLGDSSGAIDRLQKAAHLNPRRSDITFQLVELLQQHGDWDKAKQYLDALCPWAASPDDRLEIARLLCNQAEYDDAAAVLTNPAAASNNPAQTLLLAQIRQSQGNPAQAWTLYQSLLPTTNHDAIQAIAGFEARHEHMDDARKLIEQTADPIFAAGFEETFGTRQSAETKYRQELGTKRNSAADWIALAGYQIRTHDFVAALATIQQAMKIYPGDSQLKALGQISTQLQQISSPLPLDPLLTLLSTHPTDEAGLAALNALLQSQLARESLPASAQHLTGIADQYPASLPIQILAANWNLSAGHVGEAERICRRAMDSFPTESEPARLLTRACRTRGETDSATVAATQWHRRTLENPKAADIALADLRLQSGDPQGALNQLQPYQDQLKSNPDTIPENVEAIRIITTALARTNHWDQVTAWFGPLAPKSPQWRQRWLDLAVTAAADAQSGRQWIEQIAPQMDSSPADQCMLATAWLHFGQRFVDTQALTKARAMLRPLGKTASATGDVWLSLGQAEAELHNHADAESDFRKALDLDPSSTEAQNDLAELLLQSGSVAAARPLAETAVQAQPAIPSYHQTLAQIDAQLGDWPAALEQFNETLDAGGNNLHLLLGKALAQQHLGQGSEAHQTLATMDAIIGSEPALSANEMKQLNSLREKLKTLK